ncbi:MAG: endoribonuclease YicC domain-containing protein [Bacteroidota bacterium]
MNRSIMRLLDEIQTLDPERVHNIRARIEGELAQLKEDTVDKNRFEQELIYYIEKLDISEEKVRLQQHCEYFDKTMKEKSSGKKLSFIAQEMGREINTIGSKANHFKIQQRVVEMKDELEKIKEQLNNVI